MKRAPLGLAIAIATTCASATPTLPAPLELSGPGPYYLLTLPMGLQSASQRSDLGDLRVRNASGEALPLAWTASREDAVPAESASAIVYKVPLPPAAASATTATPPPQQAWIVDTREPGFTLERLTLALAPGMRGVFHVRVEAGDDLRDWRAVQPAAQLVSLAPPAGTAEPLESTDVDLGTTAARYLRLTALGTATPAIASATVLRSLRPPATPPLAWSEPITPDACTADHCDYALPRNVPIAQLQVSPAEANTVARLELYVPASATSVAPHRHPLHRLLRGWRDKESPRDATDARWTWIASTNAYWLGATGDTPELRSPPIALDAGLPERLRLVARGPMRALGAAPPTLRIGTRPVTMVFLARGPAPYRLDLATTGEADTAMPLADLMPGRKADDPLPAGIATPATPAGAMARPAAASAPATATRPASVPWLWAALLGGVALMGAMAWSLVRRADKT